MEPRKTARRGRTIYECPDCGYQMEITEPHAGRAAEDPIDDTALGNEDEENGYEEEEDNGDKEAEI